jgi:peptidyl-prolyl cis-trans isomerase C
MAQNSKQNIITVISVIAALIAVAYALMGKMPSPQNNSIVLGASVAEGKIEKGENNPVVMIVNGEEVTRTEVLNNFVKSGSQLPEGANLVQVFPLLQEQYLLTKVISKNAAEKGVDSNHPEVQKKLQSQLEQAVRAAYIDVLGKELVKDEDVKKAYDDIIANAPSVKERQARHILLDSEVKANELIAKLDEGADFSKLAVENSKDPAGSNGGDLGYFAQGDMVKEFSEVAFSLPVGTYTKSPVKTQFGYHIIKVENERDRPKPEFETVKEQLYQQLSQAAVGEKIQESRKSLDVQMFDFKGDALKSEEKAETVAPSTQTPETASEVVPTTETPTTETPAVETPAVEVPEVKAEPVQENPAQ